MQPVDNSNEGSKQYTYTWTGVTIEGAEGDKFGRSYTNNIALSKFELSNIDEMREAILAAPKTAPFNIGSLNSLPYTASIANTTVNEKTQMAMRRGSTKQDWE